MDLSSSPSYSSSLNTPLKDSNITFDKFKVATEGESEIVHLFGGGNRRMVGCGVNSADNSNDDDGDGNLIYKTKANAYDTIFHVKPPGVASSCIFGILEKKPDCTFFLMFI